MTDTEDKVYQRMPDLITVRTDRARRTFNRQALEELADSIKAVGQLQPGLCTKGEEKDEHILLVGERRLRACRLIEQPFTYLLKEDITDSILLAQMQMDENLHKEGLPWKEEVSEKLALHELFIAKYGEAVRGGTGGHTYADTARYLGKGRTLFYEDVQLAKLMDGIPEIAAAPNKTTAKKIAKRIIVEISRQKDLDHSLAAARKSDPDHLTFGLNTDLWEGEAEDEDEDNDLDTALAGTTPDTQESQEDAQDERIKAKEKELTTLQLRLLAFDSKIALGDMVEEIKVVEDGSIDIILFDPPWGVELSKVRKPDAGQHDFSDKTDIYRKNIKEWLQLCWDKMSENSHLYLFFAMGQENLRPPRVRCSEGKYFLTGYSGVEQMFTTLQDFSRELIYEGSTNFEYTYETLSRIGFTVNRMPLIWYKRGARFSTAPTVWHGKCYETIAYARKGSKDLAKPGTPNIIETPMPTPKIKDLHPAAKHPEVFRKLLEMSGYPGDKILDPMCGAGMSLVAAESLRLSHSFDWYAIEQDMSYRNLAIINLANGYEKVTGGLPTLGNGSVEGSSESIRDLAKIPVDSYKELVPGCSEWSEYWDSHPDEQKEMLAWGQRERIKR